MAPKIACLLILCSITLALGMYFDLAEKEERCIIEDIPQDTMVTGYFLLEYWETRKKDTSPHLGLTVTVKDPNFETVMSKKYSSQGKFTFKSHLSGQYFLCMKSNSTRFNLFAGDRLRLHLDVQMGEHSIDPGSVKAQDTVKNVEFSVQHLIDQVRHISKQQAFQREREETFRKMSEQTNGSVLWWAVVQTVILVTVGIWQMKRLKDFLIEKKLV